MTSTLTRLPELDDSGKALLFTDARTANSFADTPVDDDTLAAVWELAKWAPTAANTQPLRVAFVRSDEGKARLVSHMNEGNRAKTASAPVAAILAVDNDFHEFTAQTFPVRPEMREHFAAQGVEARAAMARFNGAMQAGYFILAARAHGLAAGPMAGFDADAVTAEFFPGGREKAILVVNLGVPGDNAVVRPPAPAGPRRRRALGVTAMTDTRITYAVTGATGGLGHGIVTSLLARDVAAADVVAVVRDPARATDLTALGVDVRTGDYDRPDTLPAALAGVDVLVLVSGSEPGRRIPQHSAVVEAAVAAGVGRIVYTSAPQADTSSFSLVDEHRATEELLHSGTVPFTVLRNNWYVENYTRDLDATLARGSAIGSAHDGLVGVALRSDYAEAAAAAAVQDGHENATYELAGPLVTLGDFYAALSDATGTPVAYVDLSTDDHLAALLDAGLPEPVARFVVSIDTAIAQGELATPPDDLAAPAGPPGHAAARGPAGPGRQLTATRGWSRAP